jgi:hypothetical protein
MCIPSHRARRSMALSIPIGRLWLILVAMCVGYFFLIPRLRSTGSLLRTTPSSIPNRGGHHSGWLSVSHRFIVRQPVFTLSQTCVI